MSWDRGFKRLYIALSVLYFLGAIPFSYVNSDRYTKVPCTQKHIQNDECLDSWIKTDPPFARERLSPLERLPDASKIFGYFLIFWISYSAIWLLVRWVILGFKSEVPKTVEKHDLPEEFDSPSVPPPNAIKGSVQKLNDDFSEEISEERLNAEFEKSNK
jgi:hypothetical protein